MKNKDVVECFFGKLPAKGSNLVSTGDKLISYATTLAQWQDNILYINLTKYSVSTSRIQNFIKGCINNNITIVFLDDVPRNTDILTPTFNHT